MQPNSSSESTPRKRNARIETWPESASIYRCLIAANRPLTIREIALRLVLPEVTTKVRLNKLELVNAVFSSLETAPGVEGGSLSVTRTYSISDFGRECLKEIESTTNTKKKAKKEPVANLSSAMSLWGRP